jgi:hypothetical protein
MSKKRQLQHYLISVPLHGGYIHGYVMTNDKRVLMDVADRLIKEAEGKGLTVWPPMILQTHLSDGWELVREVATNCCGAEPSKHWDKAKNFHMTGWIMAEDHPDTRRLMDLH